MEGKDKGDVAARPRPSRSVLCNLTRVWDLCVCGLDEGGEEEEEGGEEESSCEPGVKTALNRRQAYIVCDAVGSSWRVL
mgnify:FL=1